MKLIVATAFVVLASALQYTNDLNAVAEVSPELATLILRANTEPEKLAAELRASPIAQLAPVFPERPNKEAVRESADATPIVITHGMGDSCFNPGMKQITADAGTHKGVYSVCVPGGDNQASDTISGFLVPMDKNVDIFAAKVRNDTKLKDGFDAVGLSQGNSVIRGYIERYNEPPVRNYLAIHGTVMGVAGFPNCNPSGLLPGICDTISKLCGDLAYSEIVQNHLFQANYFRDPTRINTTQYKTNSQIAAWNNENPDKQNPQYTKNFESVKSYNMIKALKDTMVFPNEGEHWGQFTPGQFKTIQTMKETPLFTQNLFGLQTVATANKIVFNTTAGEHLQFTVEQLNAWIDLYFN